MKNLHVLYSVKLEKIFASSVENRQKLIFNNKNWRVLFANVKYALHVKSGRYYTEPGTIISVPSEWLVDASEAEKVFNGKLRAI